MIMYFSATGNSEHCAEYIADKTGDDLFSIAEAMKKGIKQVDCGNDDILSIVVPTYDWGIPWSVANWLREVDLINLSGNAYIYSIHTCGNMSGASAKRMRQLMESKGLHLNAAFSVVTLQSEYLFGKKTSAEEAERIMGEADGTLDHIIEDVRRRNNVVRMRKTMPAFAERLAVTLAGPSQRKVKKFKVSDACIGCGKCARGCPQNIIEIRNKKPVWTENRCLNCLACVTYCPKQAISNR